MTSPSSRPIGIFDSGVGGLTVMRAVADLLPDENIVYLGDTARVPYGNRSAATVRRYAVNATSTLVREEIKALVVACNTASAYSLDALRERFDIPIVGVIEPVARRAAALTRRGAVGVIGTRGTIASGSYRDALRRLGIDSTVQCACPLFVPLAEEGWTDGDVVETIARSYLATFADTDIDELILGCTHYPILADAIGRTIEEIVQRPVQLLDSASATAAALSDVLAERKLQHPGRRTTIRFWATDDPARFRETAHRFFGADLDEVEHVDIVDVTPDEATT
jgi:glutamate racemase